MKRRALLFFLLLSPFVWLFKGCSQFADSTPCTTSTVYTAAQIRGFFPNHSVIQGDISYAEVNPAFAPKWHDYMGKVMSLLGMAANWTNQFDCNRFANVKLAVIHIRFLVDTWHKRQPGTSPAAGEFWFIPGAIPGGWLANLGRPGHAIVVTIEGGQKTFRDIYTERALTLTAAEQESAYLIKF